MSKRADRTGQVPGGNRIAAFLFSVLPATMILGVMAPGVVETQLVAAQSAVLPAMPERVAWQPRHFKTPLLVPNEILLHRGIDLQDVSLLLDRFAQALAGGAPIPDDDRLIDVARLQTDPEGDTIVIDDVNDYVEEEIFAHSLEPGLKVDLSDWWPASANVISNDPATFGAEDGTLFDDQVGEQISPFGPPPGGVANVPEPASGALVSLGLALLALRRRCR